MKESKERIDKMKKNKGFTLIELLAVIVILAIIALIAVPVVMNIINSANKSAFKDSAYGLLKAGELFYTDSLLENAGLAQEKTFTFPNNIEGLEFKGSKPSSGKMTVNKDGKIAMAITNGKYCVTKGFDDDDVAIKEDDGKCVLESYNLGDIVYYNPNEAKVCTEAEWNNNTDKNGKTGCMRWYVYALNGSTPKLILDHNTTNKVAWISAEDYEPNEECGMGEDWANTCNDQGPKTLMKQLDADTENWKIKADIITAEEVANLIPYYQNLSDGDKQLFLNPTEENTSVIFGYLDALDAAWNDENMPRGDYNTVEIWKAQNAYMAENHSDIVLPKYMYEDIIGTCENVGNEEEGYYVECGTYGYWTKTAYVLDSSCAWGVGYDGRVGDNGVYYDDDIGLRPVITLSK